MNLFSVLGFSETFTTGSDVYFIKIFVSPELSSVRDYVITHSVHTCTCST